MSQKRKYVSSADDKESTDSKVALYFSAKERAERSFKKAEMDFSNASNAAVQTEKEFVEADSAYSNIYAPLNFVSAELDTLRRTHLLLSDCFTDSLQAYKTHWKNYSTLASELFDTQRRKDEAVNKLDEIRNELKAATISKKSNEILENLNNCLQERTNAVELAIQKVSELEGRLKQANELFNQAKKETERSEVNLKESDNKIDLANKKINQIEIDMASPNMEKKCQLAEEKLSKARRNWEDARSWLSSAEFFLARATTAKRMALKVDENFDKLFSVYSSLLSKNNENITKEIPMWSSAAERLLLFIDLYQRNADMKWRTHNFGSPMENALLDDKHFKFLNDGGDVFRSRETFYEGLTCQVRQDLQAVVPYGRLTCNSVFAPTLVGKSHTLRRVSQLLLSDPKSGPHIYLLVSFNNTTPIEMIELEAENALCIDRCVACRLLFR